MSDSLPRNKPTTSVWITKPDLSAPELGFFSIKLGKGCLDRALAVLPGVAGQGKFAVFLDGVAIAPAHDDWRVAFGRIYNKNEIIGTRLEAKEYVHLVRRRQEDHKNGLDLDAPVDLNVVQLTT